jgi:hypothetical protein
MTNQMYCRKMENLGGGDYWGRDLLEAVVPIRTKIRRRRRRRRRLPRDHK